MLQQRDISFHSARVVICASTVVFCACLSAYFIAFPQPLYIPELLFALLWVSAIGELSVRAGTLWFIQSDRTLPPWPIVDSLRPFARWTIAKPAVNNIVMTVCAVSLVLSIVYRPLLLVWLLTFSLLCVCDLWRLFYTTYQFFGLACYAHAAVVPSAEAAIPRALVIMLGAMYFWSGFAKLVMADFYRNIAPWVFGPLYRMAHRALHCVGVEAKDERKRTNSIMTVLFAFPSILLEALMGIVLFTLGVFPSFVWPWWALRGVSAVSLLMHSYIILYMGIFGLKKRNFMVWNAKSCALTQLCVGPLLQVVTSHELPWNWMHTLAVFAFAALPLLMFVRRCPDPCLSHSYFAPNWYGWSLLLIPRTVSHRIPAFINGYRVPQFECDDEESWVPEAVGKIGDEALARALLAASQQQTIPPMPTGDNDALKQWLAKRYIAIDSTYVDATHALPSGIDGSPAGVRDTWANYYLAGPDAWWRCVVRDRLHSTPCIHLRCDDLWKHSATVIR